MIYASYKYCNIGGKRYFAPMIHRLNIQLIGVFLKKKLLKNREENFYEND